MRIMALGCSALDLDKYCGGTLGTLAKEGHRLGILIVRSNDGAASNEMNKKVEGINTEWRKAADLDSSTIIDLVQDQAVSMFRKYGLEELHFVPDFDYAAITQKNADILATYRREIQPDLVIIPHWKSQNARERILSRTAMIACRGIGSILMYDGNGSGPQFLPNLKFNVLPSVTSTRLSIRQHTDIEGDRPESSVNNGSHSVTVKPKVDDPAGEFFEAHRLLLLEHEDIDWL